MTNLLKRLGLTLFLGMLAATALSINPLNIQSAHAQIAEEDMTCLVYVTGIGCPHCAQVDPVLFEEKVFEYPNAVIVEYEIYQDPNNAGITLNYDSTYNSGFGIPLMISGKDQVVVGDRPILEKLDQSLKNPDNYCPLVNGPAFFEDVDFSQLPKNPKIWTKNRVLFPIKNELNADLGKQLILAEDDELEDLLKTLNYTSVEAEDVPYSGGSVDFKNAVEVGGWILQWHSDEDFNGGTTQKPSQSEIGNGEPNEQLTLAKLVSLAVVDAINPCALAVLTLMLIGILTYNPRNRRNILLAGLAFSAAVFFMYIFYGLVIIKFFQLVQMITSVRIILHKVLGIVAIFLGIMNIRDFISYKPGSLGTEMPMFMRPKMKKMVEKITSPSGAFLIGLFVTVFLLPCTIGPYVIAGGILSTYELLKTIPPLLLYNLIFITPMLIITAVVYFGLTRVENVSDWKDKNIRYLHLTAGAIMFLLGLAMLFGWV